MRGIAKLVLALVAVLGVAAAGIYFSGNTQWALAQLLKPRHGFDPAYQAPQPDYAEPGAWAALTDREDLADLVPVGVAVPDRAGRAPVDVFFVHPTTYLHGEDWNDPLASGTITEENTRWTLANQASAYNGCCDVYAPRYRQTSIFHGYADEETGLRARELAYDDVAAAFDHFLEHMSDGRPFILAGHSQGTRHAHQLLRRRIAGTELVYRMIAAYLIGGGVARDAAMRLVGIRACAHETDLHCLVHWATFGDRGDPNTEDPEEDLLCTNPLSWRVDESRVDRSRNRGAVLPSGRFNIRFWGENRAAGVEFGPLPAPIPGHTWAQCRGGRLLVEAQVDNGFSEYGLGVNYHGLDYALFYMDIRENAQRRVDTYLAKGDRRE